MTRKKRRALLCMLAVPLLALAPRSEESLPASAAEPAAVPEKYVALTFDDGPWPETTEQLLDGLAERGAKATFFLIGEQIAGHEDTVRRGRGASGRQPYLYAHGSQPRRPRRAPARDRCDR